MKLLVQAKRRKSSETHFFDIANHEARPFARGDFPSKNPDQTLSRSCHFIIEFNDSEIKIVHKSKSNPTVFSHDGRQVIRSNQIVGEKIISESDYIYAGEYRLRFRISESSPQPQPVVGSNQTKANSGTVVEAVEIVEPFPVANDTDEVQPSKQPTSTPNDTYRVDDEPDFGENLQADPVPDVADVEVPVEPDSELDFDSIGDDEFTGAD